MHHLALAHVQAAGPRPRARHAPIALSAGTESVLSPVAKSATRLAHHLAALLLGALKQDPLVVHESGASCREVDRLQEFEVVSLSINLQEINLIPGP